MRNPVGRIGIGIKRHVAPDRLLANCKLEFDLPQLARKPGEQAKLGRIRPLIASVDKEGARLFDKTGSRQQTYGTHRGAPIELRPLALISLRRIDELKGLAPEFRHRELPVEGRCVAGRDLVMLPRRALIAQRFLGAGPPVMGTRN